MDGCGYRMKEVYKRSFSPPPGLAHSRTESSQYQASKLVLYLTPDRNADLPLDGRHPRGSCR